MVEVRRSQEMRAKLNVIRRDDINDVTCRAPRIIIVDVCLVFILLYLTQFNSRGSVKRPVRAKISNVEEYAGCRPVLEKSRISQMSGNPEYPDIRLNDPRTTSVVVVFYELKNRSYKKM